MEWMPIETAPVDKKVIMGWWITYNPGWSEDAKMGYPDRLCWKSHAGVAKETKGFGPFKWVSKTSYGQTATHWFELPDPPRNLLTTGTCLLTNRQDMCK